MTTAKKVTITVDETLIDTLVDLARQREEASERKSTYSLDKTGTERLVRLLNEIESTGAHRASGGEGD